jgi:hypothetical protein
MVLLAIMASFGEVAWAKPQVGVFVGEHVIKTEFRPANDAHRPIRNAALHIESMFTVQHALINIGSFAHHHKLVRAHLLFPLFFGDALSRRKFDSASFGWPQSLTSFVGTNLDFAPIVIWRGIEIPIFKSPIDATGGCPSGVLINDGVVKFFVETQWTTEISEERVNPRSISFNRSLLGQM